MFGMFYDWNKASSLTSQAISKLVLILIGALFKIAGKAYFSFYNAFRNVNVIAACRIVRLKKNEAYFVS